MQCTKKDGDGQEAKILGWSRGWHVGTGWERESRERGGMGCMAGHHQACGEGLGGAEDKPRGCRYAWWRCEVEWRDKPDPIDDWGTSDASGVTPRGM